MNGWQILSLTLSSVIELTSEIDLMVYIIVGLTTAVASLAGYIVHMHQKIIKLTQAYAETTTKVSLVVENNTKAMDRVLDRLDRD